MNKRKICVVTGTRAEYGQLKPLMGCLKEAEETVLQLVATGMHLSPEFGLTYQEIEADGFAIDRKVETLLSSDTATGIGKSTGLGVIGFADAFADLRPDLVVLLGDRFEILAAAIASLYARIPIAHLHGGETTEGAFDEGIRHAVTKMSHLHFVAAEEYRSRVLQLGEEPSRVHNVGGFGIDAIKQAKLLSREELERQLDFKFGQKTLLVTFHPVTLEHNSSEQQIDALLEACGRMDESVHFVFTMPNADTDGRVIAKKVDEFVDQLGLRAMAATSLGQLRYWSALQYVDAVVGNSSSGISEAPSFKIGTVNIGDRQKGRLMASSVVCCEPLAEEIERSLQDVLSEDFTLRKEESINPYGTGGASQAVFEILRSCPLDEGILKKHFHDVPR
ncbi:MAG: UDP-N-acetylglucosamine 2-epimerase [Akkermansiaceae bacterium]